MEYYASMNEHCNDYSAEACAIAEALKWCYLQTSSKDILLLMDSLSTIQALQNNRISTSVNDYIIEIRKRYFELSRSKIR